ncbi:hypothetical protein ThvES_00020180 [Thiovulum sp. ES]|nr:hypothetical protein ThvES_00020180 [Thiovulum sp. ES]
MKILSQNFTEDTKIRILLIDEKEFFVAKDIATLLEHCKKPVSFRDKGSVIYRPSN